MPRTCLRTSPRAPKSTFISIGMIITQMSRPTGTLTRAISMRPTALEEVGQQLAGGDARDDAQEDPDREIALEDAHRRDLHCRHRLLPVIAASAARPAARRAPFRRAVRTARDDLRSIRR